MFFCFSLFFGSARLLRFLERLCARGQEEDAGDSIGDEGRHHLAAHARDSGGALSRLLVPGCDLALIPAMCAPDVVLVVLARPARRRDLHQEGRWPPAALYVVARRPAQNDPDCEEGCEQSEDESAAVFLCPRARAERVDAVAEAREAHHEEDDLVAGRVEGGLVVVAVWHHELDNLAIARICPRV